MRDCVSAPDAIAFEERFLELLARRDISNNLSELGACSEQRQEIAIEPIIYECTSLPATSSIGVQNHCITSGSGTFAGIYVLFDINGRL
jgi:hypothetical protein